MQLSANDLYLLSQCAISAALQAGQMIENFDREKLTVKSKQAGISLASQVVTEVDLLSQAIILQNILPSCDVYDLALLTEESPDDGSRLEKDYFWCIDPLDGTLPFIEGVHGYSVCIALVSRESVPMIGVVYDPVKQVLYHAVKGAGVFRNGQPWFLSKPSANQSVLNFISDRSFVNHPRYGEILDKFKSISKTVGYKEIRLIRQGGGAMNACWVLEKSPACYFKFPSEHPGGGGLWDFSATACLFNEINATVSDIHGQSLELNRVDSTFMNHRGVVYVADDALATLVYELYQYFED